MMIRRRLLLILSAAAAMLSLSVAAEARQKIETVSLERAIADYNAKAQQSETGRQQPPLTMEEVIAAIRLRSRSEEPSAPERQWRQFKQVAETRILPPGAEFEVLRGMDLGGEYIYAVWYIRLMLRKDDGGTYSFTIRDRVVRARHVSEVAREQEKMLNESEPLPGRYRIEDRLKDMQRRAAKAARDQEKPQELKRP